MSPQEKKVAANGLPTIGLLLADMHTGSSSSVWSGVAAEASRRGMNLFCFPGGKLEPGQARGSLYELAGPECLDGLLTWPSSFADKLPPEETETLHARFSPLHLVSLTQALPGIPSVSLDAYPGTRALIEHLVGNHGFRRVAFIRGPSTHSSAEDRYRAYRDALRHAGITLDDRLVSPPMSWKEGEEAARILLDERGLRPGTDIQAIAAASDMLAFGAMGAILARGYHVPGDLAVTGFNDNPESRLASPPLTTAAMPFETQAARALDSLGALMEGRAPPLSLTLPPRLVIRESCGCPSSAAALAVFNASRPDHPCRDPVELPEAFSGERAPCLREMAAATELSEEAAAAWLAPILDAYLLDVAGGQRGLFISTLGGALDRAIRAGTGVAAWQGALSVLRRRSLGFLPPDRRQDAENLLSQARVLAAEASERGRIMRQWRAERQAGVLRDIGTSLLWVNDIQHLCDALDRCLPLLGIGSFYLSLAGSGASEARLVLARTDRVRAPLPAGGLPYPSRCIVPRQYLPRTRRYAMAVVPLAVRERRMAFAVLEMGPSDGAVYEALRVYLSSALTGALLLQEAEEARAAAEKADTVKSRLLANVSHELRTPLDIIIRRARGAREGMAAGRGSGGEAAAADVEKDLAAITANAEHQLRVINDLLDLSRAEIDELDLTLAPLDPRPLLVEVFQEIAEGAGGGGVAWRLSIPDRLPMLRADGVRLRQILLNLLSNAAAVTTRGSITLAAEVDPPCLHLSVADTGPGVPEELRERIFEPFVSAERASSAGRGIGLGLSIARHLALLHGGSLTVDSDPGNGSVFHVRLPLPALDGRGATEEGEPFLALLSRTDEPPPQIAEFCARRGLAIRHLRPDGDWEAALGATRPAALAWDLAEAEPGQWELVRRLRHHPRLFNAPVVLYARASAAPEGLTGMAPKSSPPRTLIEFIEAARPADSPGPLLIVDDDPAERASLEEAARAGLPDLPLRTAGNGREALAAMAETAPCLVVLDLMMPELDGFGVLEKMREDPRLRRVPVLVLTHKQLDPQDVRRLESHSRVTLQSKGVWSPDEAAAAMHRALFGGEGLPAHTSAIAKRALSWLAEHHGEPVSRWQLADAVHASEDYLCRVFRKELGLSPWEYLNRYRVHRARQLLREGDASVKEIAAMVGFRDQAYFCRVFRKVAGVSPQAFRDAQ